MKQCYDKCITRPTSEVTSGEVACSERCAQKWAVTEQHVLSLLHQFQQQEAQKPSSKS